MEESAPSARRSTSAASSRPPSCRTRRRTVPPSTSRSATRPRRARRGARSAATKDAKGTMVQTCRVLERSFPFSLCPSFPLCPLSNMHTSKSRHLFSRALRILPGGVDSPVRAFSAVGGRPLFIARARGSRLEDVDGNSFVDYVMSWGPLIHGHAPSGLVKAVAAAARKGTSFGAPSPLEVELGERVRRLMPSLERVRFANSGTEPPMSPVRAARQPTGPDRLVQFPRRYHGHAASFL